MWRFATDVATDSGKIGTESWQNGYCTGLENRRPQGLGGSNPSLSAFLPYVVPANELADFISYACQICAIFAAYDGAQEGYSWPRQRSRFA